MEAVLSCPLSPQSVVDAATRISGHVVATPVLESPLLNQRVNGRVLMKAECLQPTGAFKYRGATHFLMRSAEENPGRTVVTYSSGNHAQAVAATAALFGFQAIIVMPEDAPAIKLQNTKAYGAEVVLYNRYTQDRLQLAAALAEERQAILMPPFEHPWIISGQGTAAYEMLHQTEARLDALLVPSSGGGLLAGSALALQGFSPSTQLFSVEPQGYDDIALSQQAGHPVLVRPTQPTLCDALMQPIPGELAFQTFAPTLTGGLVVEDTAVLAAMRWAFDHLKIVLEPGGAIALAAVLSHPEAFRNQNTGLILSGGNVDPAVFLQALSPS